MKWTFTTTIKDGEIALDTTLEQEAIKTVSRAILDTKEKAIRDALIRLGWTPPSVGKGVGVFDPGQGVELVTGGSV